MWARLHGGDDALGLSPRLSDASVQSPSAKLSAAAELSPVSAELSPVSAAAKLSAHGSPNSTGSPNSQMAKEALMVTAAVEAGASAKEEEAKEEVGEATEDVGEAKETEATTPRKIEGDVQGMLPFPGRGVIDVHLRLAAVGPFPDADDVANALWSPHRSPGVAAATPSAATPSSDRPALPPRLFSPGFLPTPKGAATPSSDRPALPPRLFSPDFLPTPKNAATHSSGHRIDPAALVARPRPRSLSMARLPSASMVASASASVAVAAAAGADAGSAAEGGSLKVTPRSTPSALRTNASSEPPLGPLRIGATARYGHTQVGPWQMPLPPSLALPSRPPPHSPAWAFICPPLCPHTRRSRSLSRPFAPSPVCGARSLGRTPECPPECPQNARMLRARSTRSARGARPAAADEFPTRSHLSRTLSHGGG